MTFVVILSVLKTWKGFVDNTESTLFSDFNEYKAFIILFYQRVWENKTTSK